MLVWSYGVTTVPQRLHTTLPITLRSLHNGGFRYPRLFIDGSPPREQGLWTDLCASLTFRWPRMGAMQNWTMSLWELYLRSPKADRYALFQDDFVCVRNLRQYLEAWFPERGYLNLYTMPHNQMRVTDKQSMKADVGWFPANQNGQGAVGLVFDREGVEELLRSQFLFRKTQDPRRGHKNIDGCVINVMKNACSPPFIEYCHSPSLLQHIGDVSTLDHKIPTDERFGRAVCFPGEEYDATELLGPIAGDEYMHGGPRVLLPATARLL